MAILKLKSSLFFFVLLSACSSDISTQVGLSKQEDVYPSTVANFKESDAYLNTLYNTIKTYGIKSKIEINEFLNEQNYWIKERNFFCKYTDLEGISPSNEQCLTQKNIERIDYFKNNYLNFEHLEKNIINPFMYQNHQKIIDAGGCFCNENSIKILNNKMFVFQTCDQKIENAIVFDIITKKVNNVYVDYDLDIDQDNEADFNLKFKTVGKNSWKIIPQNYDTDQMLQINFKSIYTTEPNLAMYEGDCGDFDT